MFVHGTCNPAGESGDYVGVYLNDADIDRVVNSGDLIGKPVLLEHQGDGVGRVVSCWKYNNKLDILVELEREDFLGKLAGSCVASGCVRDFSLGYKMTMSANREFGEKRMVEVSLVKKGARHDCHIKNFAR